MSDTISVRRRWWRRVALVVALAVLGALAPAAAQDLTVTDASVSPLAPTWRDRVEVSVRVETVCSCFPELAAPVTVALGAGSYRIDLPIAVEYPPVIVGSSSFVLRADLDPLEPGSYTLRVLDVSGSTLAERAFDVYEVGDAVVELPAVSTANHPGVLRVTWLAGAGTPAASVELDGQIVTVRVSSPPAFPVTHLATLDVPLPILATGRNEIRVLLPGFSPDRPRLVRSELHVLRPAGCTPDDETLCLHDGRFRVSATWRDFAGRTGVAHAAPLAGNDGSGLLWFFGPDNTELTVKVLDACTISQRWWTFVSSNSTVEYTLTVTDTATGATRTYTNPLGQAPRLVADTNAFACEDLPVSAPAP